MANLTFEQELMNTPYREFHREQASDGHPSFSELLGILNYNQGLVEFADSKAGSLILLNSLLIAAVAALPSSGELGIFKLASVLICSAAVFVCFQVVSSKDESGGEQSMRRRKSSQEWERHDFLFFGCIGKHKTGDEFCRAFDESRDQDRRRAVLQRTFVISNIASRKFSQYKMAQQITSVALAVWVVVNLIPFMNI